MRPTALRLFGIETVWRRRRPASIQPPAGSMLVVRGPWASVDEAPALVQAMVQSLQLSASTEVCWEPLSAPGKGRSSRQAELVFGVREEEGAAELRASLPPPHQLHGASARRAAWEVLAPFKRALRAQGLGSVPEAS